MTSFDWSDYMKLARELWRQSARSPIKDAKLRTAISRAYYAAYISARNHLQDKDKVSIPYQDAHQYVINYFLNSSDGTYREIGWRLKRLRRLRNKGDYDNNFTDLVVRTPKALADAEQAIAILNNL